MGNRREDAQRSPCPYCGILRGEHETRSLMVHTMLALGMTEDESEQVWDRVLQRISS